MRFLKYVLITFATITPFQNSFAIQYTIQDLGTFGGNSSFASAINNHGVVVGTAYDENNDINAFIYDGDLKRIDPQARQAFGINDNGTVVGSVTLGAFSYSSTNNNFSLLGNQTDSAYDINNNETIVGYVRSSTNYAFSYTDGNLTNLGILPGSYTSGAYGINDNGVIVGNSSTKAFVYQDNQLTSLEPTLGDFSFALDINNNDIITGYYRNSDNLYDSFFVKDGELLSFVDFNGYNTFSQAINDNGLSVGRYTTGNLPDDSFAYLADLDGSIFDLNDLDILNNTFDQLTVARDINNRGQIVGSGLVNGETRAFLLTPVPEPTMLVLFVIGLLISRAKLHLS